MLLIDTNLLLTMTPASRKKFYTYKENTKYRSLYNRTSVYIIAKRPVSTVRVINESSELHAFFDVPQEVKQYHQTHIENKKAYEDSVIYCMEMIKRGKVLALEFSQSMSNIKIQGLFELSDGISAEDIINQISNLTFEDFFYSSFLETGNFVCREDITPFITYEVLYVGHCVNEPLTKRFNAHHKLQEMLVLEDVISKDYLNSDELVLLPFCSYSESLSVINGKSNPGDMIKSFADSLSIESKQINLDCEKALVHGMNPKYNQIKFNSYPQSKDGLANSCADVFSYVIAADVILKYQIGAIYGSSQLVHFSRIVGDRLDNSVTVYNPNELFTQKYKSIIFPRNE